MEKGDPGFSDLPSRLRCAEPRSINLPTSSETQPRIIYSPPKVVPSLLLLDKLLISLGQVMNLLRE